VWGGRLSFQYSFDVGERRLQALPSKRQDQGAVLPPNEHGCPHEKIRETTIARISVARRPGTMVIADSPARMSNASDPGHDKIMIQAGATLS
jgi:hypothetical protein